MHQAVPLLGGNRPAGQIHTRVVDAADMPVEPLYEVGQFHAVTARSRTASSQPNDAADVKSHLRRRHVGQSEHRHRAGGNRRRRGQNEAARSIARGVRHVFEQPPHTSEKLPGLG